MSNYDVIFLGGRGLRSNYGGVENAIRETTLEMSKEELKIGVYGVLGENSNTCEFPENLCEINLSNRVYKIFGQYGFIFLCVLHILLFSRPRVAFIYASGPCFFTPILRIGGVKVITSLRAIDSQRDKWGIVSRKILMMGEYFSWRFSNYFTVNSKEMASYYSKYRADVKFIPNGSKAAINKDISILKKIGVEKGGFFLFAARLDPVKRLHLLLEAYTSIPIDYKIPLVIAGGNAKSKEYEQLLRKFESKNVIFLGHISQEELDPLMVSCRAFVSPSVLEGMSNSILSAMANGKAVLAANIPENSDVVKLKNALFESDNVDDLKLGLIKLASDESFSLDLGAQLKEISIANFSWRKTSDLFFDLI